MDEPNAGAQPGGQPLASRPPNLGDLVGLCRELNDRGARYLVVGICGHLDRSAADYRSYDLLVAADTENEKRVFDALATLPDKAVHELKSGELQQYNVIRVADEILVDLMSSASGIKYEQAIDDVVLRDINGVKNPIRLAPPPVAHEGANVSGERCRDLAFLRYWFVERGQDPPNLDQRGNSP